MHPNYYFSPLAVAMALGLATQAKAAEPIVLHKATFAEIQRQFQLANPVNSLAMVASVSSDSLKLVGQHTDKKKISHLRMQQYFAGFPVFGGYAIIHSKEGTSLAANSAADVKMNGTVYKGLQTELGQPDAHFADKSASVLQHFKSVYDVANLSEEYVTPMVFIDEGHRAHWAYKVSVFVQSTHQIPSRPTAIIDAKTNQVLAQWDDVKTARISAAKGQGFGGNNKIGEYQYGKEYPLLDITRDETKQLCFMENTQVKVVDMEHRYSSKNKPLQFDCVTDVFSDLPVFFTGYEADGYDKENGAASPSNDALYAGYVIEHMYKDWYGIDVLHKSDGSPMQLVMRVHYGDGYENAYWDGKQMTFGDGDTFFYPLVSLGVGAHEISHGFTEQNSGLEYYGQSGGMNEAFSDMAAQAAEFYSTGKPSWQIGAEIVKEDSGEEALRYMDLPSRDGSSIDTADEYYGGIDVHNSSGVYNHLFYILANQPQWTIRKAFDVMVKANMDYWTPYSDFEDGACGVLSAAKDLGLSEAGVIKSLKEVKIDYQYCSSTL